MLTDKTPEKAVTTHPMVVEPLIDLVREAGAVPTVGDSPFGMINFEGVGKATGMAELCKRKKIKLINLDEPKGHAFAEGNVEKEFHITGHDEEFDALIDIPKVKTHSFMLFTGAVKNLFGLISGNDKTKLHLFHPVEQSFATMLLDLYSLVKPKVKLVVMDGIIGMDGHGLTAGDPKEIGYIIAGTDALATDIIMSKVLDIRKDVPYLKIAKRYGMETADIRNITFRNGDIKDYLIKDFRLPKQNPLRLFIPFWLKNSLVHYPKVDAAKCIGCRRCYDGCP